jgi:hypothetical protein
MDVPEEFGADAHSYRPSLVRRVGIVLGPLLLFFIVIGMQSGPIRANFSAKAFLLLLVVVSSFGYVMLKTLTYRVILSSDAITVVSLFGRRQLERAAIAWRWHMGGTPLVSSSFLVLVPKDRGAKWLKIRLPLETDEAFDQWFATLPNLAQRHQQWRSGSVPFHGLSLYKCSCATKLARLAGGP